MKTRRFSCVPFLAVFLCLFLSGVRADYVSGSVTPAGGVCNAGSSQLAGSITVGGQGMKSGCGGRSTLCTGAVAAQALQRALDSDCDGVSDEWDADNDGDQMPDGAEIHAGYDPCDRENCLEITALHRDPAGRSKLRWKAQANKTYSVYCSESIQGPYELVDTVQAHPQQRGAWQEAELELPNAEEGAHTLYFRIRQHE